MGWIGTVATSQFLWGILIGVILSALTSWITHAIQKRHAQSTVGKFCSDIIVNTSELVEQLNDTRERRRLIDQEFLDLISVELGVYGQNRQHMVAIHDDAVRRDVRDFLTKVASHVARVRIYLREFDRTFDRTNPDAPHNVHANSMLANAHNSCDSLRDLVTQKAEALNTRLRRIY